MELLFSIAKEGGSVKAEILVHMISDTNMPRFPITIVVPSKFEIRAAIADIATVPYPGRGQAPTLRNVTVVAGVHPRLTLTL